MSQKKRARVMRPQYVSSSDGFNHNYNFVFSDELPKSKCSETKAKRDAKKLAHG